MGHDHPKHFLSFLISLLSHIQLFLPEMPFLSCLDPQLIERILRTSNVYKLFIQNFSQQNASICSLTPKYQVLVECQLWNRHYERCCRWSTKKHSLNLINSSALKIICFSYYAFKTEVLGFVFIGVLILVLNVQE